LLIHQTQHHWYPELSEASEAPILHIVDTVLDRLLQAPEKPQRVGVIATQGTLDAGWFQQRLSAQGIETLIADKGELATWFVPGCYAVKRGHLIEGGELLSLQAQALLARGAQQLILACTEVPVALRAVNAPFLAQTHDPARVLAERCSRLWQDHCLSYLS